MRGLSIALMYAVLGNVDGSGVIFVNLHLNVPIYLAPCTIST